MLVLVPKHVCNSASSESLGKKMCILKNCVNFKNLWHQNKPIIFFSCGIFQVAWFSHSGDVTMSFGFRGVKVSFPGNKEWTRMDSFSIHSETSFWKPPRGQEALAWAADYVLAAGGIRHIPHVLKPQLPSCCRHWGKPPSIPNKHGVLRQTARVPHPLDGPT